MHILFVVFVICIIVFGFGFVAYESEANPTQIFSDDVRKLAKSLTTDFPDGSQVKFALDPQPPTTEFIYEDVEVVKEVLQANGTYKEETVIEKVPIEVSEGEFFTTNKNKKICNIG